MNTYKITFSGGDSEVIGADSFTCGGKSRVYFYTRNQQTKRRFIFRSKITQTTELIASFTNVVSVVKV